MGKFVIALSVSPCHSWVMLAPPRRTLDATHSGV
jgi:hypothetical protein